MCNLYVCIVRFFNISFPFYPFGERMAELIVVNETLSPGDASQTTALRTRVYTMYYAPQSDVPCVMRNLHVIRIITAKGTSKLVRGHYREL